ncbi:MAG: [protein-PII] uridylyltransferase [Rhodobacteraceae bacterium]|nr:[protein-PII] uridylyltransferase [Paracoccaceae bacterium]MCY4249686.1 [protein-PII] uridylyltransferase [Paracoccaceae bacterium]
MNQVESVQGPKSNIPQVDANRLILDPKEIFDPIDFDKYLVPGNYQSEEIQETRRNLIKDLVEKTTESKKKVREANLFEHFLSPYSALKTVRSYSYITDCIVQIALEFSTNVLFGKSGPESKFSVFGVGGYGRGEMAPQSDVDLLMLLDEKSGEWENKVIEGALYIFWDLNLKVGHSVRTLKECLHFAKEDLTIRTALLECRLVWGPSSTEQLLHDRMWNDLFKGSGPAFVEAKLEERESRYKRQGGNRYLLEPNVKEAKGGLRDLQTLFWIVKYLYRIQDTSELVGLDVLSLEEYEKFISAESFLWAVRCQLHDLAKRPQDVLHFNVQFEVAKNLGYEDMDGRQAVEYFMQDYFRHATDVGDLTRILLTKLEAQHVKREPILRGWLKRARANLQSHLPTDYKEINGRLSIANPDTFLNDKLNLLRLFEVGLDTGLLLHPDSMRLISSNLHLIDQEFIANPEANKIFIGMLLNYGNPERVLRRMNELNVLGRFIPEFSIITALMQFNSYHHYTVDEHTIQCLAFLAKLEKGELKEDLPVATSILEKGVNRKVLYVALLLHDIGKGRNADHSTIGAELAKDISPRFGLDDKETEHVVWLVKHHLLMSDTSQKRDISDPKTVINFAKIVGTRTKLKLLTVLTVCDIMGVGPGVWNHWKAQMIRNLYNFTHSVMTDGSVNFTAYFDVEESKKIVLDKLQKQSFADPDSAISRHGDPFWRSLAPDDQVMFIELLDKVESDETIFEFTRDKIRGATRLCMVRKQVPDLFSKFAGILALLNVNIVDAKSYSTSDGYLTSAFWLQDPNGKPFESVKLKRLSTQVKKFTSDFELLKSTLSQPNALQKTVRLKKTTKFTVPTEITFDNKGSDLYTIVEVDTQDRPGLLYDLVRTLNNRGITVVSSVVATYGVQAVDVFYVKDKSGLKILSDARLDNLRKHLSDAINQKVSDG